MTRSKVRYRTQEAAEAAISRRRTDPDFRGGLRAYRIGRSWFLTSKAFQHPMPNFRGGGWARDWLTETIELGTRVSWHLNRQNQSGDRDG